MTLHSGIHGGCCWALLSGRIEDADVTGFVAHIRGVTTIQAPDPVVLDLAYSVSLPNPMQRKQIVDVVASLKGKHRIAGHAVVTNTAVARGVLQAVNWFVTPAWAEKVFRTPREATTWLQTLSPELDVDGLFTEIERAAPGFRGRRW